MRLHDFTGYGNGHKVRLLLSNLGHNYVLVEHDILKGETHKAQFLARNPDGKIPLLETDDGRHLPESNAILWYLAENREFLPADAWDRAQALRWMSFKQYGHEPYVTGPGTPIGGKAGTRLSGAGRNGTTPEKQ